MLFFLLFQSSMTFRQNKAITKTSVRVLIMTVSPGNSFSTVQFILCKGGK